jgi:hypothetical protein
VRYHTTFQLAYNGICITQTADWDLTSLDLNILMSCFTTLPHNGEYFKHGKLKQGTKSIGRACLRYFEAV